MMKAKKMAFVLATAGLALASQAKANITLLDADGWKFLTGGFAEMDMFNDSTQSLTEVVGNTAIAPNGYNQNSAESATGSDGRTFFSDRNSRFDFTILPPVTDGGWQTKAYMEFDFLGYDPQPNLTGGSAQTTALKPLPGSTVNSETGYFENPTLRIRHMYMTAENGDWKVLIGQTWDLFGFSPDYVLDTVSLSPVRGDLYERTPQMTLFNTMGNDTMKVGTAISMERPVQDDSQVPGFDAALRFSFPGWTGAYASASGAINAAPASIAVSGKINTFEIPNQDQNAALGASAKDISSTSMIEGSAVAVTALIPVIPAGASNFLSSLVLTGEFSAGSGYGDEFSSWTGGEKNFASINSSGAPGTAGYIPGAPNLDAGQGGYYNDNSFHLVNLESFNMGFQYALPDTWNTFFDGGYSQLYSDNISAMAENPLNVGNTGQAAALNGGAPGAGFYNLSTGYYVNVFHDFTKQFRMAFEYDHFTTGYVLNNLLAVDNRFQLSAWLHF